ncbi:Arm DNA-binding domain-containing protein [Sphingobium quisquiliarum]|nr:Arm DNA-binding domain-containing protein [Sphingobium quisquiliarum]
MLTYIQINAAKPKAKAWTLSDSQGLHLQIQPNGSKLWRFKYRFLAAKSGSPWLTGGKGRKLPPA